ncbi:MAG: hypothetical protein AAF806_22765 [Bacteroidota bacterium]
MFSRETSDQLGKELSINRVNLQKIAKGYRDIPKHRGGDSYSMMKKYGFDD